MRKSLLLLLTIFLANMVVAQQFKIGVAYNYMAAPQWDYCIKTYNFSRPFNDEKQPLLKNGVGATVGYLFKSNHTLKQGINLTYSYFGSLSENQNFNNKLNLHFLSIGYLISFQNPEKSNGFYTDCVFSLTTTGLFRNINGEPFIYDDETSKAFGIGGSINVTEGYNFKLKNNCSLSPYIAVVYTPYLYSPNTEAVINQTKGLIAKSGAAIFSAQAGLCFSFK